MRHLIVLLIGILFLGCQKKKEPKEETVTYENPRPQVISKLGTTYFEPVRSEEAQAKLESQLETAYQQFKKSPSEMNYVWYGRRMAYLSRYKEAIEIYTKGISQYPGSYKLYRHRGHRYISIRMFDEAIKDLEMAVNLMPKDTLETEPDGIPNKLNKPLSSTQFNVWYHLALAHYLKGEFEEAKPVYEKCMEVSVNDDLICATADWQYMTLRRLGRPEMAADVLLKISDTMNIIENDAYYKRLLMYKGQITPDSLLHVSESNADPDLAIATQGYGLGNWYLYNGDTTKAVEIFNKVIDGKHWSAFGFIAAEADLVRLQDIK